MRIPFSAAKRRQRRVVFWIGFNMGLAVMAAIVWSATIIGLRPASDTMPVAAYVTGSGVVAWIMLTFSINAPYRSRSAWHVAGGIIFAGGAGVWGLTTARQDWHLSTASAAVFAASMAVLAGSYAAASSRRSARGAMAWAARQPASPADARAAYDACLRTLNDRRLSAEERRTARLNLARAAIAWSGSDDEPDGLVQAAEQLTSLLDDPPDDWLALLFVAIDMCEAVSVRASKNGDVGGYPAALEILAAIVPRMPPDAGADIVLRYWQADYHATLAGRLLPGPEQQAQARASITSVQAAIAGITRELRPMLPELHALLGGYQAYLQDPCDIEAGIRECRTAVRLARWRPRVRADAGTVLASLLIERAYEIVADLPDDATAAAWAQAGAFVRGALAEAGRLLRYAWRYGRQRDRPGIRAEMARARDARALLLGGPRDHHRAARAYRDAAAVAARDDALSRIRLGQQWVSWAVPTENPAWCAEAYWYLMSVVAPAVAVRYLPAERDRVLAGLQSAAAEAGYWLAEAGRVEDAAIALELGRAVSLTEVLGREWPDMAAALALAGRGDLAARYDAALTAYRAAAPEPGDGVISAAQRAWAALDAVTREIAATIGIEMPGTPPTLGELSSAARDGPLVYLAATSLGGYAITVRASGPPAYLPLPGLTSERVASQATAFVSQPGPARVAEVIAWLWDSGMRELAAGLPGGTLATIIPAGLLGLLPVHASGGPTAPGQNPADWAYLADRVTVRYAHNARTLLHARNRAAGLAPAALSLLAVAAPGGEPRRSAPLAWVGPEVGAVGRQWPGASIISDGSPATVASLLGRHNVWHFACHCKMAPDAILDSELLLTGGRLSLRDLLALPPAPRRLAVLSACETSLSGTVLPDEATGLPAGLLQVGFAGVIAAHWPVHDRTAAPLMARFHELWHGQGLPPAAALAQARRWLRTASAAQVRACLAGTADGAPPPPPGPAAPGPYGHPFFWAAFALTGD